MVALKGLIQRHWFTRSHYVSQSFYPQRNTLLRALILSPFSVLFRVLAYSSALKMDAVRSSWILIRMVSYSARQ
jgi:hypothetical protein